MPTYLTDRPLFGHGEPVTPAPTNGWNSWVRARMSTGEGARDVARMLLAAPPLDMAVDIETVGLDADALKVKCVTYAVEGDGLTYTILLDPRREDDYLLARALNAHAARLIFHNAPFDVPALYQNGLMSIDDVGKVVDTLVTARLAYPGDEVPKGLEALGAKVLGNDTGGSSIAAAFSAAGFARQGDGFAAFDIDRPVYCLGAMADTVVALRLYPAIIEQAVSWLLSSPFVAPTVPTTREAALTLVEREQVVNRVMLKRSARGIAVDAAYLDKYLTTHVEEHSRAGDILAAAVGAENVGNGAKVVAYLHGRGELPVSWPTTKTGRLKADAEALETLGDHPLAAAHLTYARLGKVTNYLTTVADFARVTSRVHPQVGILKAVSGRMSYSNPALQQFSRDARPILVPDNPGEGQGWTSIDWSSIEPVVMANCAGDDEFIRPFNAGADLYIPTAKTAGLIPADMSDAEAKEHPGRKTAKTVLLAGMYGQGRALLAKNLKTTEAAAADIQNAMKTAMPTTWAFMDGLRREAENTGRMMTADGRLLPIPNDEKGEPKGYVGVNFFCQGTAASVLNDTLFRLDRAGLGDAVQLAIHDELVVDAEAAGEVRAIMETPPAWLTTLAGRTPVFRTDANPLPYSWLYV